MALKDKLKGNVNSLQSDNSALEFKQRLQPDIIAILNLQIANELQSSQIYRGMSCWLDNMGFTNAAEYFVKSADEELVHMRKIYKYLFEKNCKAVTPTCTLVQQNFTDMKEILTKSLEHEIVVTGNWEDIANLACEKKDKTTMFISDWFLNEQLEEESKWRDLLYLIDFDMPKWRLEEIFKELNEG